MGAARFEACPSCGLPLTALDAGIERVLRILHAGGGSMPEAECRERYDAEGPLRHCRGPLPCAAVALAFAGGAGPGACA